MGKLIAIVMACCVAGLLTACGGSGGGSTTSTTTGGTSAAAWADSACKAITTYKSSVDAAVSSVTKGQVSKSSIQHAADQLTSATQTFATTVKNLGKPNTQAGAQAKQSLDQLSTELSSESKKITTAAGGATSLSGVVAAAPEVANSLKAMGSDISTTFKHLDSLDASGELSNAFKQSSACQSLKKSS